MNKKLDKLLNKGKSTYSSAVGLVEEQSFRVEQVYEKTKKSILDTRDNIVCSATKIVAGTAVALSGLIASGLVISSFVAPVPTLIGIAVIWLIGHSIESATEMVGDEFDKMKEERENARILRVLQKYGRIPETSVVSTDGLTLRINAKTNEITGEAKVGSLSGAKLETLSLAQLNTFMVELKDTESMDALNAYIAYRMKLDGAK